ncbi:MAG: hypothetical protein Q4A55_01000 [Aerococcus sp.]|nr:hypothetical protein [Aerococcus sp.]
MQNPTTIQTKHWFPYFLKQKHQRPVQKDSAAVVTVNNPTSTMAPPAEQLADQHSLSQAIHYYYHQHALMALTVSRQMGPITSRERLIGYFQTDHVTRGMLQFFDVDNQVERLIPCDTLLTFTISTEG